MHTAGALQGEEDPATQWYVSARARTVLPAFGPTREPSVLTHRLPSAGFRSSDEEDEPVDSDDDTEQMNEDEDADPDEVPDTDIRIKLIVGGSARRVSSSPYAAILRNCEPTFLRFGMFRDETGLPTKDGKLKLTAVEVFNLTILELQHAAVDELASILPYDETIAGWKDKTPELSEVSGESPAGDTLYLRNGPADDALITHLYIAKGGTLEWITSGQQLIEELEELGTAAQACHREIVEVTFCLRRPAGPKEPKAAAAPKPAVARKPGRPAPPAQEQCVNFELSCGTKQTGPTGAPKFTRTSLEVKQVLVPWADLPLTGRDTEVIVENLIKFGWDLAVASGLSPASLLGSGKAPTTFCRAGTAGRSGENAKELKAICTPQDVFPRPVTRGHSLPFTHTMCMVFPHEDQPVRAAVPAGLHFQVYQVRLHAGHHERAARRWRLQSPAAPGTAKRQVRSPLPTPYRLPDCQCGTASPRAVNSLSAAVSAGRRSRTPFVWLAPSCVAPQMVMRRLAHRRTPRSWCVGLLLAFFWRVHLHTPSLKDVNHLAAADT